MTEKKNKNTLVEEWRAEIEYGFKAQYAIIDHHEYGRILIFEAYCGENTLVGGMPRWGAAIQLKPGDTSDALCSERWNEIMSRWDVMIHGRDPERHLLMELEGYMIEKIAKSVGLD